MQPGACGPGWPPAGWSVTTRCWDRLVCVGLTEPGCGSQRVWGIEDDAQGGLWVATSTGLYRLDASAKVVGQWHTLSGQPAGAPYDPALAVLRDHAGVVWIGTSHGLARLVSDTGEVQPVSLPGNAGTISHLMEDGAGRIWIGTRQAGAYMLPADRGQARLVPQTGPAGTTEIGAEVTALLEVTPGRVWIGTYGRGIVDVDVASQVVRRIVHDVYVPSGLNGNGVQALYRDRSGLVWIATEDGLSQDDPATSYLMTFFGNPGRPVGLTGESAMSVLAMPDGSLWTGLQGEGFAVLDPAGRRATGLPGYRVFTLAPSPSGGVLLGTDGGLFLADASGRHVTRLKVPDLEPTPEINVLRTVGDTVWLAPLNGGVLAVRIDPAGSVTVLRREPGPDFTNPVVDMIHALPDGAVAIGTDSGLNLLDPVTGTVERIYADPSNPAGLSAGLVTSVATDRRGRLWVGTATGLDVMESRDHQGRPRFRHLGVADGLPSPSIDSLLVDAAGHIWAATDLGLAVIDPDRLAAQPLRRADGLAITNYWNNSATITASGEMVFGGIGGLTMVSPGAAPAWPYHPPLVVTGVRIGGRLMPNSGLAAAPLVIPADANSLAVEFAALDFSAPEANRYSYRLEGFDRNWIDADAAHRIAAYTNLPPGKYTLWLRGSNPPRRVDGHAHQARCGGPGCLVSDRAVPPGRERGGDPAGAGIAARQQCADAAKAA